MTGTSITLPIRVDVKTGKRLTPRGDDPRATCAWVEGAADGMGEATRKKYAHKIADLAKAKKNVKRKDDE